MIRPIREWFWEHIFEIETYHLKVPLARHVCLQNDRDPRRLKCWVLEVIPQVKRGGVTSTNRFSSIRSFGFVSWRPQRPLG